MLRKLNPLLALAAGLAGGLLSRYVSPVPVQAQAPLPPIQSPAPPVPAQPAAAPEIRAQSFTLVDPRGNTVATFRPLVPQNRFNETDGIVLLDRNGHEIWRASSSLYRPATQ